MNWSVNLKINLHKFCAIGLCVLLHWLVDSSAWATSLEQCPEEVEGLSPAYLMYFNTDPGQGRRIALRLVKEGEHFNVERCKVVGENFSLGRANDFYENDCEWLGERWLPATAEVFALAHDTMKTEIEILIENNKQADRGFYRDRWVAAGLAASPRFFMEIALISYAWKTPLPMWTKNWVRRSLLFLGCGTLLADVSLTYTVFSGVYDISSGASARVHDLQRLLNDGAKTPLLGTDNEPRVVNRVVSNVTDALRASLAKVAKQVCGAEAQQ